MQTIQKTLSVSIPYQFLPNKSIKDTDILLFDIETTGFSPDTTSIYLIGCCYYRENFWHLTQFFADDYISEQRILQAFIDIAKSFKVMIHFNGNGFDIPYIQKKLKHYNMEFSFDSFLQIDLYKKIFPYKKLLHLPNLKQKTIEDFLNLPREDEYSGGELIDVYVNYMKDRFGHRKEMTEEFHKLLIHNEEDVTNLILLTSILTYSDLFEEPIAVNHIAMNETSILISFSLQNSMPCPFLYNDPGIFLEVSDKNGSLKIDYHKDELKYFYPNYKDYYYLPEEDTAIHKSVAEFVDKDFRVKAKAATCYTKKSGIFLPQYFGTLEPAFRRNYKEKDSYIELTDSFLSNFERYSQYTSTIIQYLLHSASKKGC